jgi:hypothetical protein
MTFKAITRFVALAVVAALLVSIAGCCPGLVRGSGNLETREMEFADFTQVNVSHAFRVDVDRTDSYQVTIIVDDNLWDYVDVRQSGQTLYIGIKGVHAFMNVHLEAHVTMPEVHGLTLSGASYGDVSGFSSADPLDVNVSGASTVDMDGMEAGDAAFEVSGASKALGSIEIADGDFEVSGASTIDLDGSANNVSIEASGASRVKLEGFAVNDVNIELSGASAGTVNAAGTIDADLSGASHLDYMGNATLGTVNTSGASSIDKK